VIRRWPGGVDDRGADPRDRIDHIFVARGLAVTDARYVSTPASDHPLAWVAIGE